MKTPRYILYALTALLMASCGQYANVQKSADYEYRYEAAKSYFVEANYTKAATLLSDLIAVMKGTAYGEESLYMLAQSEYGAHDYEAASNYFKKYVQTYPKGLFVEQSRFYTAMALYQQIPDVRLDQTSTWDAIKQFQEFMDYHPYSRLKAKAQDYIVEMQDRLVEKEYLAAKLYFDLGNYMTNCLYGGSNYEACIVTAENAQKDFPYATPERREQLSLLILRSKYQLAKGSVDEKRLERYRATIDEYYAFVNDFPESKHLDEAKSIFKHSDAVVKKKGVVEED